MIVNRDGKDYPEHAPGFIQDFYEKLNRQILDELIIYCQHGETLHFNSEDDIDLYFFMNHLRINKDLRNLHYSNWIIPYNEIYSIKMDSHL